MQLTIAAVGKLKAGPDRDLFERYAGRVAPAGKALKLGPLLSVEISESRRSSTKERRVEEASALLAKIPDGAILISLDENGDAISSGQFAELLRKQRDAGVASLVFALGGPDGHGAAIAERAARTISLGAITLPHGLARIVLAEQIYRALTILAGHPYHRN
jgi:23S rRNA (pseudouridine1915-N3)-methyltransferase